MNQTIFHVFQLTFFCYTAAYHFLLLLPDDINFIYCSNGNGKPLVFLKLLNIPHELHLFSWPTKDIKQDWYLKLNPQGLVPTLVDGELILPESNAILQYLAETYDKQGKFSYNLQTDPLSIGNNKMVILSSYSICWYFV